MANRQEQQRRGVSARQTSKLRTTSGGVRSLIKLSVGTPVFELKSVGIRKLDIINYRVTKGNETVGGNPMVPTGSEYYERTIWVHRGVGVANESFLCPLRVVKKKCPICEHRNSLVRDPKSMARLGMDQKEYKDYIGGMQAKQRQLFNVIDLDDVAAGVHIWEISYYNFGEQLEEEINNSDEAQGLEYFADIESGMSLRIGVKEDTMGVTNFYRVSTIDFRNRKPYPDSILEKLYDLDDLLIIPDYVRLKSAFLQTEEQDQEEGGDEAPWGGPVPGGKRGAEDDDWGTPVSRDAGTEDDWSQGRQDEKPEPKAEPAKPKRGRPPKEKSGSQNRYECPACSGKGKNSRGNACKPCGGKGFLDAGEEGSSGNGEPEKGQDDDTIAGEVAAQAAESGDDWDTGW